MYVSLMNFGMLINKFYISLQICKENCGTSQEYIKKENFQMIKNFGKTFSVILFRVQSDTYHKLGLCYKSETHAQAHDNDDTTNPTPAM